MAHIYATPTDYQNYAGQPPPTDAGVLLAKASRMLDAQLLRLCWYEVDDDGMPTHPSVRAAVRDAACAQVEWWAELGDSLGAAGAGWGSVSIGSVQLSRSVTGVSGEDSPARQIAPQVWDTLRSPDLTPDIFRLGDVTTW